ncbi:MAG: hypothetical protein ACJ8BF_09040 [Gemmatimonadales bacterium]
MKATKRLMALASVVVTLSLVCLGCPGKGKTPSGGDTTTANDSMHTPPR